MLTRVAKRLGLAFKRVIVFFGVLFLVSAVWSVWSTGGHQLGKFCSAMVPGTSVAVISGLSKESGLGFVRGADEAKGKPGLIVVAAMTPFLTHCEIKHDGNAVLSTEYFSP